MDTIKKEIMITTGEILTYCANECQKYSCDGCPIQEALNRLDFLGSFAANVEYQLTPEEIKTIDEPCRHLTVVKND